MHAHEIVAALAKDTPFAVYGNEYIECSLCEAWAQHPPAATMDSLYEALRDLARHDAECPWRQAREYMGGG